jgi:hypothetical protein
MNIALSVKHTVMLDTTDHYVLANLDAKRNALEQVFSRYLREWPRGEDESSHEYNAITSIPEEVQHA